MDKKTKRTKEIREDPPLKISRKEIEEEWRRAWGISTEEPQHKKSSAKKK